MNVRVIAAGLIALAACGSAPTARLPSASPSNSAAIVSAASALAPAVRAFEFGYPDATPYRVPIGQPELAGWGSTHSTYKATDIFVAGGCGGAVVSPVNGVALEVRTVDLYDPTTDNPAQRGGRSVSILGDDGVRYYFAHFESIHDAVVVGARLGIGQTLGTVGDAGRSSACHLHFGISPPCPDKEWSMRRGVVWPHLYLNAWKSGQQLSPASEVATWLANNPDACTQASADPFAPDA